MNAITAVARREVKALFDHPTGYILVVIFVAINNFLFFRTAYTFNTASLRGMLELMPWLFLFFIPAVTMRSIAEDRRSGTIEIMLAQPLTELEYVLGKYLGQVAFIWFAIGLTLLVPIGLSLGSDQQVGVVIAQYVGTLLLAAGLTGVGVWTSSLTKNQITAFIVGVSVMFLLILIGLDPLLLGLSPTLSAAAARLGVLTHFRDIARGVIDLRDVVYFLTLAAIFLALAYNAVMRQKLARRGAARKRLQLGVAMGVAGLVIVNLLGRQISGRIDLTPGNAYTLSSATRDIVSDLGDLVTIKLFVSEELPPEIALLRRDLDDLLRDYQSAGGDKIRLVEVDPSQDEEAEKEVRSLGIPPVQFNVVGESGFTIRDGYMGIAVQYLDKTETIPFVRQAEDLEYRISSLIKQMSDSSRTKVAYYVAPSEQQQGSTFGVFREQLTSGYQVTTLNLQADTIFTDDVTVAVIIGAPDSLSDGQRAQVTGFLRRGGSVFLAASGMQIGQQQFAMARPPVWNRVFAPYGVSIGENMVYDLASNERVAMQTNFGQLPVGYPLWPRALSTQASPVNQGIESVFLPWTSTVDYGPADSATVIPLLVTSQAAGVEQNAVMINPGRQFSQEELASRTVAAMVNPLMGEEPGELRGRLALVGTSQFLIDRFMQGSPDNASIALNIVDWLAQDEGLMTIRSKNRAPPTVVFESETMKALVKWFNIAGVPVLLIIFALVRLARRRARSRQPYGLVAAEVSA